MKITRRQLRSIIKESIFGAEGANPEELTLPRSIQKEAPWLESFAWMLSQNQEDSLGVIKDLVHALYLSPFEEKAKLQAAAAEWVTHKGDDEGRQEKEDKFVEAFTKWLKYASSEVALGKFEKVHDLLPVARAMTDTDIFSTTVSKPVDEEV